MDFDEGIAERLTGLFRACGYSMRGIRVHEDGGAGRVAEVEYEAGTSRLVNITLDGALAACHDIIAAVGHFG